MATLALLMATSGTAVAAGHYLITSTKQIKPSVLAKLRGAHGAKGERGEKGQQGSPGTSGGSTAGHPRPARKAAPFPGSRTAQLYP